MFHEFFRLAQHCLYRFAIGKRAIFVDQDQGHVSIPMSVFNIWIPRITYSDISHTKKSFSISHDSWRRVLLQRSEV